MIQMSHNQTEAGLRSKSRITIAGILSFQAPSCQGPSLGPIRVCRWFQAQKANEHVEHRN
jgi:hypothetical protein